MKRLLMVTVLALSGCGGGGDSSPSTAALSASLVGSWSYVDDATQCEDVLTFHANGDFAQTSLDERLSGSYSLLGDGQRKVLTIAVDTDNTMPDCLGGNDDNSGQEDSGWIEIEENRAYLYDYSVGGHAHATIYRVE